MSAHSIKRIGIIGFGEVGGIFGADFSGQGLTVTVTDILLRDCGARPAMITKAQTTGVAPRDNYQEALSHAELVISAVTSSAALDAANEAAQFLTADQIYLDINSVSPEKKREVARVIEKSQAVFVEAAVMAPISPQRLKVPMLLGGPRANDAAHRLSSIGMNAKAVSERIGVASAIKMCRSVLIKGLEALAVECLFAARRYDAEEEVLASLEATYPSMGWENDLPDYLVSRVAQHGRRRAAEMREVAAALKDVDFNPMMAMATASRQDWLVDEMAKMHIAYDEKTFSWIALADDIHADSQVTLRPAAPKGNRRE